jgi:thiosulfate dehydrogenase
MQLLRSYWWLLLLMVIVVILSITLIPSDFREYNPPLQRKSRGFHWIPPDSNFIPVTAADSLIRYGRDLIARTAVYLGPKGSVARISNGMNCQNCHLQAGTKHFGNNYSAVYATYPRFRGRSGTSENIFKRVNDCLERSLNGKVLDTTSREMLAIEAYISWLGKDVPKNVTPVGAGIAKIPLLERPADPLAGKNIYKQKCMRCHGSNGEGQLNLNLVEYTYPPLWGKNSYTTAAGLFRLSHFAGYVRRNMPFDAAQNPAIAPLTDEEAWDVAAFVNSQPRPHKNFPGDWPDISLKPFDLPFGPYADSFPESRHKYGPFQELVKK